MVIKTAITERVNDLSPKILSDLLLLSTKDSNIVGSSEHNKKIDLFDALETNLILKMKSMSLDDLIQLMWSSIEMQRGSALYYKELEKELTKRIRGIKDD
jgi:hypothetical protein